MALNPESRVSQELLDELSGVSKESARIAYGKARDEHSWNLPYFVLGQPVDVQHYESRLEMSFKRDPYDREFEDWSYYKWARIDQQSSTRRCPVLQVIEPAEWYYDRENNPGLLVVASGISVAGLVGILNTNEPYRLYHEGSNGSYRRVWASREDEIREMREEIAQKVGLDLSQAEEMRRGNSLLFEGEEEQWCGRQVIEKGQDGKLYTPEMTRDVLRVLSRYTREKKLPVDMRIEIDKLRENIASLLEDVRDKSLREEADGVMSLLREAERGLKPVSEREVSMTEAKELLEQWQEKVWEVPIYGTGRSGERETRHDLPYEFSFYSRRQGRTGRSAAWVIDGDGKLVDPTSVGYRRDDYETWGPEVLTDDVVIITHEKAYTAAEHEFGVRYEPQEGITLEQLDKIKDLQQEIDKEWKNATGMSGKVSPSIGDGWGFTEEDLTDEARAKQDEEINAQDMGDMLAALRDKFNS